MNTLWHHPKYPLQNTARYHPKISAVTSLGQAYSWHVQHHFASAVLTDSGCWKRTPVCKFDSLSDSSARSTVVDLGVL